MSHSAEIFRCWGGGSFTVAKISSKEKVSIRGGGGVSRFSVGKRLSHSPVNLRTGTL